MSYDISLQDHEDEYVLVPHFLEGGVVRAGINSSGELIPVPTYIASVNVTWNYNEVYVPRFGVSLRGMIEGKLGMETWVDLATYAAILGTDKDEDYWKPTEGNAGAILDLLAGWAVMHPTAKWWVW